MTPLTARQIAEAAGGTLVAGDGSAVAACVSTDSKTAPAGCVFVALRGDTYDGHAYLGDAARRGSTVALIDRDDVAAPPGVAVVRVPDARRAMGRLATVVRRSATRPKVIAVGGSNGKTSTKNTLHRVLSQTLRGTASPASFNNDVGVPATLFPVSPDDDYVIVEIGTNHPGEVGHLSRMCEPDVAVITSIGEEHLEFFGSLDAVRQENAAIVAGLRPGGLLVTCDDAGLLDRIAWDGPRVTFSAAAERHPSSPLPVPRGRVREGALPSGGVLSSAARAPSLTLPRGTGRGDKTAADVRVTLDGTRFRVDGVEYTLPAIGAHFAANALAVIAVARHFGLDDDAVRRGLAAADASAMRMQRRDCGGVTVLNDAYNANPTSTLAAIDTLRQVDWPGRKIAVLGEMKELGGHAAEAHARVATAAGAAGFDAVFAVGAAWRGPAAAIGATWFDTSDAAAPVVAGDVAAGDLVLLKASRSVRLERVADAVAARHG